MQKINIPENLREFLTILQKEFVNILAENLVGIYIYGSLSHGDFREKDSDVDIFVITKHALNDQEKIIIEKLFENQQLQQNSWLKRLEMDIFPQTEFTPQVKNLLNTVRWAGQKWNMSARITGASLDLKNLQDCGITLQGIDPKQLIPNIEQTLLLAAVQDRFQEVKQEFNVWGEKDLWNQMYFTLQFCRLAYNYAHAGAYISKQAAGLWGKEHLPAEFKALITLALTALKDYSGPINKELKQGLPKLIKYLNNKYK